MCGLVMPERRDHTTWRDQETAVKETTGSMALMQFFFANNYSDISGSGPHKICLNLFQINWKGFIYSPLNNIFIGIFWNWCSFSFTKMQALVTISNHPFKKITLACIACLGFISTINGSLTTAFGSTAQATDNWPFQNGS